MTERKVFERDNLSITENPDGSLEIWCNDEYFVPPKAFLDLMTYLCSSDVTPPRWRRLKEYDFG